jgi:hypothetical protein
VDSASPSKFHDARVKAVCGVNAWVLRRHTQIVIANETKKSVSPNVAGQARRYRVARMGIFAASLESSVRFPA